ncbi:MAG: HAD family phosphatase [Bergeyella sp.]|nr:HAD family phosphatase [Bergeyella sp.]
MIKNIVFDFGGVLMDWNPRYFYADYFKDLKKMEYFLSEIATFEWNAEQDRGRTLQEGTELLVKQHPDWEKEIRAYYDNWKIMLKGDFPKNVAVLRDLEKTPYRLYGLTNWSSETFPYALENYDFFRIFGGKIVVSGEEKCIKPDPKLWHILSHRYSVKAEESVFIDDNENNIATAEKIGFKTIHATPEIDLKSTLEKLGVKF